jgi:hypothetical protein
MKKATGILQGNLPGYIEAPAAGDTAPPFATPFEPTSAVPSDILLLPED